jgi:gag-polypeptide of LTR copia-type
LGHTLDKRTQVEDKDSKKASAIICLALDDQTLAEIDVVKRPYEILDELEQQYNPTTPATRLSLKRSLQVTKMTEGEDLHSYIAKFEAICINLAQVGAELDPEDKAITFLIFLSPTYEILRTQLELNAKDERLTYSGVKNAVIAYIERTKVDQLPPDKKDTALFTQSKGGKGGRRGHKGTQATNHLLLLPQAGAQSCCMQVKDQRGESE